MADRSKNPDDNNPRIRPFVRGRAERDSEPQTFSYAPARPFSITGASRRLTAQTSTASTSIATPQKSPTPLWTVAVYEPGLEHSAPRENQPARGPMDDFVDASLALADDVREAQRHAASLAAADTNGDHSAPPASRRKFCSCPAPPCMATRQSSPPSSLALSEVVTSHQACRTPLKVWARSRAGTGVVCRNRESGMAR